MTIGYVLVNCELGSEEQIIEELKKMEEVKDAFGTFGAHDLIVKVDAPNLEKLKEVVSWSIQKMDKVRSTVTLVRK